MLDFRLMRVIRAQRSYADYRPSLRVVVRLLALRLLHVRLLVAHCSVAGQVIARHRQRARGMERMSLAARMVPVWLAVQT
ncbi:MAG: hypothetical protein K0U51_08345 [Actinomycetia bacterium]|nr:hypothetical protein [Actinomycetes bacterium]MCH9851546.1 hypothetical protein [Actinomycetes bacterium]